jgi:hypothetical protein
MTWLASRVERDSSPSNKDYEAKVKRLFGWAGFL